MGTEVNCSPQSNLAVTGDSASPFIINISQLKKKIMTVYSRYTATLLYLSQGLVEYPELERTHNDHYLACVKNFCAWIFWMRQLKTDLLSGG